MRTRHVLIWLILGGCNQGDETGLPQPIPIPENVRAEGVDAQHVGNPLVVGLPGSVEGAGDVTVESHAGVFETMATKAGTFSLVVTAKAEEIVLLRFNDSEPAEFLIRKLMDTVPPITIGPRPGVPPIEQPTADMVTVVGQAIAKASVFGVNLNTGDVATTTVGDDIGSGVGVLRLNLPARSGDLLRIYLDSQLLQGYWALEVP